MLVEEEAQEPHSADAIGKHVVGAQVGRGASLFEPFDQGQVPRGPLGIERDGLEYTDEVEQLTHRAGTGDREGSEMMLRRRIGINGHDARARIATGSSSRLCIRGACAAAEARRSMSAARVGGRSRMMSAPMVILSEASWPTRHMIASIGLSWSVTAFLPCRGFSGRDGTSELPLTRP